VHALSPGQPANVTTLMGDDVHARAFREEGPAVEGALVADKEDPVADHHGEALALCPPQESVRRTGAEPSGAKR